MYYDAGLCKCLVWFRLVLDAIQIKICHNMVDNPGAVATSRM